MAQRKNTNLGPVLDNSAAAENPDINKSLRIYALNEVQFNGVIRQIKKINRLALEGLAKSSSRYLALLGVAEDASEYVQGTPEGSDQFDPGTLNTWMSGVKIDDADSVRQLVAINATATVELKKSA